MSKITSETIHTLKCDSCGQTIETSTLNTFSEDTGWKIHSFKYPIDIKSIEAIFCPDCIEKQKQEDLKSTDIRKRINAGYYKDMPTTFYVDVCTELRIDPANPKSKLLYDKCYDLGHSSGYYEVYNYMEELVDLIR